MQSHLKALPVVVMLMACSACKPDPLALSDSAAKKLIERTWNGGVLVIPVGRLTSVGNLINSRQPDRSKGEVSQAELQSLRVWEQLGFLKISEVHDLSKGFSGWNDFFALSQNGVQTRFVAAEGPKAPQIPCSDDQRLKYGTTWGQTRLLCVPDGEARVERIVQNELHPIGADHYRAIMGTHTWTPSQIMSEYLAKTGQTSKPERKFMVALKHDPFSGDWKPVAVDIADRDAEFQSNGVTSLLGRK
jgi:hypothetical protein